MLNLIKANKWFFIPYIIVLLIVAPTLILFDKGDFSLWVNSHHTPGFDKLFSFTNYFGEAILYIVVLSALLLYKLRYTILGALVIIQTGILTFLLKTVAFPDIVRPKVYFAAKGIVPYFVEGVYINSKYSFPSGHTATAFSMLCFISLVVLDKRWGLLFFALAVFGALARIYLMQHFLIDTFFGSILGVIIAMLNYYYISPRHWYDQNPRYMGPLHKAFRKK